MPPVVATPILATLAIAGGNREAKQKHQPDQYNADLFKNHKNLLLK
jgi:hypothetical protein